MADPSMVDGTFLILQEPATWWDSSLQILQAGSIIGAGLVAIWGISAWRREMIGRKKADLAESTLAAFYEARDIFLRARFPGSFGGEGQSRESTHWETEKEKPHLDSVYVPAERLLKRNDFFAQLEASKYRFMALFDERAASPFATIKKVRNDILRASGMLITTAENLKFGERDEKEQLRKQRAEWETVIGWRISDPDPLADRVEAAIKDIEQICRPILIDRPHVFGRSLQSWLRRQGNAPS